MSFLSDNTNRIESAYQQDFANWQANPTPANAGRLLKAVQPEIDRGIAAHVGRANPLISSRARRMTLQAIRGYDPTRAKLGTHIVNHLQGLKRVARQQTQILPIPERVSIDLTHVDRAKADLADELGREPNDDEIADYTGLSAKRLRYVRQFRHPVAEGTITAAMENDESMGFMPAVTTSRNAWLEFVYSDMDDTNKKIMEWTLGLHGQPVRSNLDIARRLRITPGAVSQRKAKIQETLNQEQRLNPFNV